MQRLCTFATTSQINGLYGKFGRVPLDLCLALQLPVDFGFVTEDREKPTHLKEKLNKNCLVCTAQPKDDSSLAGLFRETGGFDLGVVETTPARTSPCVRGPPPSACGFLASEKSKLIKPFLLTLLF